MSGRVRASARRPASRYAILAVVLAVTAAYHVRLLRDVRHGETVSVPFFAPTDNSATIDLVTPEAAKAGIHRGDTLVAVNGRPYTGTAVLAEAFARAEPGSSLTAVLRSPGSPAERTVQIPVTRETFRLGAIAPDLLLQVALPILCLMLGFWAAAVRPHDPLAWLLLLLMLAFPEIFESHKIESWGPVVRELAMTYHMLLASSWAIAMYFFGLYFPEPFPAGSRLRKIWSVLLWIGVVPLAVAGIAATAISVVRVTDYRTAAALSRFLEPFRPYLQLMVYAVAGSFFAAIFTKSSLAISADARRRLRLLYWGTTIAMTPALIITVVGRVEGKFVFEVFPDWLVGVCLALVALFPLTLAYVIIVQRAMDVRVVLRQGVQYALAKNGARVLQFIVTAVVVFTAASLAGESSRNRPQKITVLAGGIACVVTIRRGAEKLRSWIDRRFFREAYNAEQVLTELSDHVRTIVETRPLLETVATRIADTLHVGHIAVLLAGSNDYRPAYALGYPGVPETAFPSSAATIKYLAQKREPSRVYLDDPDSWIYTGEAADEQERTRLAELQAELLLPLSVREKLLGFITLGSKRSAEPYSGSDVRLLKSVAAQTGLALENANLMRAIADEVAQRERLNREVEIAREVQERLFPQKLPEIQGLDYAGHCRPALGVGGDYYDFLALPRGQLGVAVGDVSGKGIAAALMMASLQASLRGEATRVPENLAAVVANVNRLVFEASSANRYATFFYGQFDPEARQFYYVNAGHNPPMLFHRTDGQWELARLEVGGTVVGLLESPPYQQACVQLHPGDILVAFTDGISEAMNESDEEWGEAVLAETIRQCADLPAVAILERILQAADAFVAGAQQHDDMTLVVLRILL